MPVRPMSSRPARSSRRASFAEDQHPVSPIKSRPKTSHVSGGGRRRWGGSPPPQPKVEESPEEELLSNPDIVNRVTSALLKGEFYEQA